MHLYSALIDIGKNGAHNHVPRGYGWSGKKEGANGATLKDDRLTAAEVILLRRIHGDDSVLKIENVGSDKRSVRRERERLVGLYGERRVTETFGPPGAAGMIPDQLDLSEADEDEDDGPLETNDGVDMPAAPARKTLTLPQKAGATA